MIEVMKIPKHLCQHRVMRNKAYTTIPHRTAIGCVPFILHVFIFFRILPMLLEISFEISSVFVSLVCSYSIKEINSFVTELANVNSSNIEPK